MKKIVIGMAAEVDAGKTTLSEALLFHAGAIRSMGRVDNRNTFFDTRGAERERGITIFSKQAILSLPGTTITLIDTPGHVDFSTETERVMNVLDYAILVISAADGYNIIHAWDDLRQIAEVNIDGARGKLLDVLSNYAAYRGIEVIAVFDSYRVPGHAEESSRYHNIEVVFTKQSETADAFIDRYALQHARRRRVYVATSDEQVQIGIRSAGGYVISAHELASLVRSAEAEIRERV